MAGAWLFFIGHTTKNESSMILIVCTDFHITYMADLSGTTKIEALMITVCWREFHIKTIMKKICIICPSAYPHIAGKEFATAGGAENQLKTLGISFLKKGYEIHFIVDDFGQPDIEIINKIIIHKVSLKYRGGANYYLPVSWYRFIKTLNLIKADCHLIKFPKDLLLPLGLYSFLERKKVVFIGQSDGDTNPAVIKQIDNYITYWFYRTGLLFVNKIIAQNKKQQIEFKKVYNKNAKIIKSMITLPETDQYEKKKYILWVGNNSFNKQPEKFLKLAEYLPEYNFKMIMSPTAKTLSDNFITDKLHLVPNLKYIGYVPFSQIAVYFQEAAVFISTSLREGFPNTFLQSWQYKTPVISLNIDPDNIIKNMNLGRHSKTFERLCMDVKSVMEDKYVRCKIGENAKQYIKKYHSTDAIIKEYLKIL